MAAKRGWQKKASAADDAKALLDSLMGPSRDEKQTEGQRGVGFLAKNVCKRYLVGICPNDWFKSTKREMDTCGKIHSDQLAEEMRAHPEADRYIAEYEQELLGFLEDVCADADRWVARERRNLRGPGTELQLSTGHQKSLAEKRERYKELIDESTKLAEAEELGKSSEMMEQATDVKKDMDEILAKFTVETGGEDVCEACGVRYPLGNTPNEVGNRDSHFAGKMHEAYTTIRNKVEELREKKKTGDWEKALANVKRSRSEEQDDGGKDGKEAKRSKVDSGRERQRSRDRQRAGDRQRSRSRDRKPRSRSREKERDREKERGRQRRSRSRGRRK